LLHIALYGRPVNATQVPLADAVINAFIDQGCEVAIHDPYLQFLNRHTKLAATFSSYETLSDLKSKPDLLVSIGGDGTILDTALLVKDTGIPIVGINAGRLGFLSSINRENLLQAVERLTLGHYSIDPRSIIRLACNKPLFEHHPIGLNEFTIHKKETSSMITIHAYLNGEFLNSYWADGLIVSTPTGSTGYSLSCGGPIIMPQSENLIITPIAPHNLNVRPIIVSDKNIISLEVEGRSQHFMATLDSRSATIDSTFQMAIKKEDHPINLVRLNDEFFLKTLRNKLNWGLDNRN
jgi:NAD+ kinase